MADITSATRLKTDLQDLTEINLDIRRKVFRDTGRFGTFYFGCYEFGHINMKGLDFTGVYQGRAKNQSKRVIKTRFKRRYGGTPTPEKLVWEEKMRNAVQAWQNLTDEEKNVYNEEVKGQSRSGYNLFIKRHLLSLI